MGRLVIKFHRLSEKFVREWSGRWTWEMVRSVDLGNGPVGGGMVRSVD